LPIPGNDDGIRSVELIMKNLADAVIAGKGQLAMNKVEEPSPEVAAATAPPVTEVATEVAAESAGGAPSEG